MFSDLSFMIGFFLFLLYSMLEEFGVVFRVVLEKVGEKGVVVFVWLVSKIETFLGRYK